MNELNNEAIILLGHGSRVPGAGEGMELVAEGMRRKMGTAIIDICYMSKLGPHFPEVFEACVARGAKKVVVMPYFLHFGLHMQEDIPEILREKAKEHPDVEVILGKNLGFRRMPCRSGHQAAGRIAGSARYPETGAAAGGIDENSKGKPQQGYRVFLWRTAS